MTLTLGPHLHITAFLTLYVNGTHSLGTLSTSCPKRDEFNVNGLVGCLQLFGCIWAAFSREYRLEGSFLTESLVNIALKAAF